MLLIGTHISTAGGLHKVFKRADLLNCESIQIFTRNQLQWSGKELTLEEIKNFKDSFMASKVLKVISHASYLINLSGEEKTRVKSEHALEQEILRCHLLGIKEVVLHPGFALEQSKVTAINKIADSLQNIIDKFKEINITILLETTSGQGSVIGSDFSDLARIHSLLNFSPRIGFCVDTCHIFAAGYDIRTEDGYNEVTSLLINTLGLENIKCWHINDSLTELGSGKDRHASLGGGEIGLTPFKILMRDERFNSIPAILETPKENNGDIENLAILRKFRST